MKVRFLGTNGWYDSKTGNTICTLIETGNQYIILDAGNGLHKIDRYINKNKPISLFLSHFHLDHIIGLHILNKFNFSQGIDIYGPKGLKKVFKLIINRPYSKPVKELKTKIRLCELNNKTIKPGNIKFKKLKHPVTCFGYRFHLENKVVTYCTDTGVCRNLFDLAKGSDLLITECSYAVGQKNRSWPHLNPGQAAAVAKSSGAKMLALVHFDADVYLNIKQRKNAERHARRVFRNTFAANDGLSITI